MLSFERPLALLALAPVIAAVVYGRARLGWPVRSCVLRALAAGLLVASLAGPGLRATGAGRVVFVCDVSESMYDLDAVEETLGSAVSSLPAGSRWGLVAFAGKAEVLKTPEEGTLPPPLREGRSRLRPHETDVPRALGLARGLGGAVVLISDGRAPSRPARGGGAFFALDPGPGIPSDVRVERLSAPAHAAAGRVVRLSARVSSTFDAIALVVLLRDGRRLEERAVELRAGETVELPFSDALEGRGFVIYELAARAERDAVPANDVARAAVWVERPLRVGYVSTEEGALLELLRARGGATRSCAPRELEDALEGCDCLVLDEVGKADLSPRSVRLLQERVRKGGGVLVMGGTKALGAGGWEEGGEFERMLPVRLTPAGSKQAAVAFVLDRSGSMGRLVPGTPERKLDFVLGALSTLARAMGPEEKERDLFSIVLFARRAEVARRWSPFEELASVARELGSVEASGGTDILQGLRLGAELISDARAQVRHVLLLSDGDPDPELEQKDDVVTLARRIREGGATVSAIGTGADMDREFLERLAAAGGGKAFFQTDLAELVSLLRREIKRVTTEWVREGEFDVARTRIPFLPLPEDFPALFGRNRTRAKERSEVALVSADREREPILAGWRLGLGRVAVFTSSAEGEWGEELRAWPRAGGFFASVLDWVSPPAFAEGAWVEVDEGRIIAGLPGGAPRASRLILPGGETIALDLKRVGFERYEAVLPPLPRGLVLVEVGGLRAAVDSSCPAELRALGTDLEELALISALSGGRLLAGPEEVGRIVSGEAKVDLSAWAALAALVAFLVELAVWALVRR